MNVGASDIGGVVTSAKGPEAGVWVIAETTELPTKFARIVVTDDQGRYLIPDLPQADYSVWVRGYGLVDSPKMRAKPGMHLDLAAVVAPNAADGGALLSRDLLVHDDENSARQRVRRQERDSREVHAERLAQADEQRRLHRLPSARAGIDPHDPGRIRHVRFRRRSLDAAHAGGSGRRDDDQPAGRPVGGVPYKYFGDWTDRIAKGELPKVAPPRPQGVERNIVITSWEWSTPDKYLHDLISSDRRNPTVNAYGPLYGSPEYSTDNMPILDPKTNKVSFFKMPVRDPQMPESLGPGHAAAIKPLQASAYWGDRQLWDTRANNHNSMFDAKGRIWLAATVRGQDNPACCKKGSDNAYAKVFPLEKSQRQVAMLDPKTMKYRFVDTCFATHHPQFGYDADNTLWFSGTGPVAGWVNTKVFEETGDAQKAQGWAPWVLDTNGNGKLDEFTEPNAPADPNKDMRITAGSGPYSVMPNPKDGSIWYAIGTFAGPPGFLRFDPKTKLSEVYYIPKPGFGIRGGDIDGNGVVWGSGSSGHLMSFDRSKCKGPLNGPKATGNHCPEGWSFYKYPGPGFDGFPDTSAEASYYTWVDQHNTLGLGENVPISTANLSDGFVALKDGKMISLRIPYPMGFYAKGLDGRIDDPNAGWKGRGLWSTNGDRTPWLMETGKGSRPRAVHIQLRPDPLAD